MCRSAWLTLAGEWFMEILSDHNLVFPRTGDCRQALSWLLQKGRDLILGKNTLKKQTELLPKPPQSSSTGRGSSPQFFLTHQTSHGSPSRGKITPGSLLSQAGFPRWQRVCPLEFAPKIFLKDDGGVKNGGRQGNIQTTYICQPGTFTASAAHTPNQTA